MTKYLRVLAALLLLAACSDVQPVDSEMSKDPPATTPGVASLLGDVPGYDWMLPASASLAPNSGLYWENLNHVRSYYDAGAGMTEPHFAITIQFSWNEVNPAEGVYNWSVIDAVVSEVEKLPAGVGFGLWPRYYDASELPDWAKTKYPIAYLSNGHIAPWEGGFNTAVQPMLTELGKRYASHPRLVHVDVRMPYNEHGESWHSGAYNEIIAAGGNWLTWQKQWTDHWVAAFAGVPHKLVSMHASRWHPDTDQAVAHDYSKSLGQRDGFPSQMEFFSSIYGHIIDDAGYINIDEDHPPLINNSFYGSENSEFSDTGNMGDPRDNWYRYQTSTFWNLVTRRNWMVEPFWVSSFNSSPFAEFREWTRYQLGQTPTSAVDAWSWTRQMATLKNFERWLYQRDQAPDGITVPTLKLDHEPWAHWHYKDRQWDARRTDVGSGSDKIYYRIDPEFLAGGPHHVQVLVTYLDGPATTWSLQFTGATGTTFNSPAMTTTNSGAWKTATFDVEGIFLGKGAFTGKMDFRVVCSGPADVTVKYMRVIKM